MLLPGKPSLPPPAGRHKTGILGRSWLEKLFLWISFGLGLGLGKCILNHDVNLSFGLLLLLAILVIISDDAFEKFVKVIGFILNCLDANVHQQTNCQRSLYNFHFEFNYNKYIIN